NLKENILFKLNSRLSYNISLSEQIKRQIKRELQKGTPLHEIARKRKTSLGSLYRNLYYMNLDTDKLQLPINLPKPAKYELLKGLMHDIDKDISDLTRYVVRGLTLQGIGDKSGTEREYSRQKIVALGLHKIWEERRERKPLVSKLLQEQRTSLVNVLQSDIQERLSRMSWAEKMAYEYNLNSRLGLSNRAIPHERLLKFFSDYDEARKKGEKPTLEHMANEAGFSRGQSESTRILSRMNLSSFSDYDKRGRLSADKISALRKTAKLRYLTIADISHFSGLPYITLDRHLKNRPLAKLIKHFAGEGREGVKRLTYKRASQIYEAQDCRFSQEETAELCDTSEEVVNYALEKRELLAPKIIRAIQTIHPDVKVTAPYINFDLSQHRYNVSPSL
ncbi:MAG: hypothetical protein AABW80_02910, partial [Nanoarchaeota archaeon]